MIYIFCAWLTKLAPSYIIELIAMDINAFCDHIKKRQHLETDNYIRITTPEDKILNHRELIWLLKNIKEFRNVWYWRMGVVLSKLHCVSILQSVMPPVSTLIFSAPAKSCGGGLYVEHGYGTVIRCKKFGEWLSINQNVTVGGTTKGIPCIGNNVSIYTGSVVVGPITIGDNVKIGANATIVKDVESNCTVCPSPSIIVKKNGIKIKETL